MLIWKEPLEFEWDEGNLAKAQKHGVSREEVDEVFRDEYKKIFFDAKHSKEEKRYIVIGSNKNNRSIFLVVVERKGLVRCLSARYMHKKEVELYEKATSST